MPFGFVIGVKFILWNGLKCSHYYFLSAFKVLLNQIHISSLLLISIPFWKEFSLYMCINTMSNRTKSNYPVLSPLKRMQGVEIFNGKSWKAVIVWNSKRVNYAWEHKRFWRQNKPQNWFCTSYALYDLKIPYLGIGEFPFSQERLVLVPCMNSRRCKGGYLWINKMFVVWADYCQ